MKHKLLLLLLFIVASSFSQNKNKTIGFKENKGQIIDQKGKPNNAVKYLLNSGGLNVQLKKNGFSYDVYEVKKHPINHSHNEKSKRLPFSSKDNEKLPDYTVEYQFHRIDIDFLNSNTKVELITEEKSLDYDNYYNIPNKPEGVLMVYQYKQITYKNIYPNIDVVFTVPKDTLKTVEYNFVVHPKGKISDIQLKFSGAQTELVDNKIRMSVRFGEMEETIPASWTEDKEHKKDIAVRYTKIKKNVYGFESAENVFDKTVIIDPVPVRLWGTYYGEGNSCTFKGIDADQNGNSYLVGYTSMENSFGFYATSGAHQTTGVKDYDGIIAKFDSDGKRVWGTYYGGESFDYIQGIKVDKQNNIVLTGATSSRTNITTAGSYKENSSGGTIAFLSKFNSSGVRIWATYFGGNNDDVANDIDIDSNNNIYIVGVTRSRTGISINNSFQPLLNHVQYNNSSYDGFLAKFNSNGNVIWSTYIGGENEDYINTIKVGPDFLVLGGMTYSENYIATANTFQTNSFNNWVDGTTYKFNLNGDRIWSTYYGGEGFDKVMSIGLDNENNIYIGGSSHSENNIVTPGSFDEFNNFSTEKGFIAKLNKDGQRIWGTYFGEYTILYSIIFKNNFLYLGGMGNDIVWDSTPITTPCTYKKEGDSSGYIGKISTDGNLIMGTFVGGWDQYSENKICFDNNDNIIIGGTTSTSNIETNSNSYQPNLLGNRNFYLMKFSEDSNFSISASPLSNSPVCLGNKLIFNVDSGYNYLWSGPNGFSSILQNPIINNTTNANNGVYNLIVSNDCGLQKSYDINVIIGDIEPPIPNLATLPTITGDCHTLITTPPTATDTCAGTITATTASPLSYSLPGTYTIVWDYDDRNNNISHQDQTVTISNQPLPTATSPQTFCIQQNATLNDITITGQNIKWYDALAAGTLLSFTTSLQNGNTYYASQTINGCESERIPVLVNIQNTPAPTGVATQSFCTSQNPILSNLAVVGTNIKWYDNLTLGNLLTNTTPLVDGKPYYATQTENNCESTNRLAVTVSLISSLPSNDYSELFCDDMNDGREIVDLSDYNFKLIATNATYNFTYYTSSQGAENELTADQISNFSNYNLALGDNKIYVRINSNTPCYAIAELNLTLVSKPIISIPDVVPICENNTVIIDAGAGFDSYLWSTGATTASIIVTNPGNFDVTVTNNYSTISCSSTKTFTVKNSTIATINTIETKDWTDTENMITVHVTGAGDFEYSIDGIHFQDSNQFSNLQSGEYTVHVRDKNGCGTVTDEVYLLMYPKFFTPNGDGYNDTWSIQFSDLETNMTIKIFDRYGKLLKKLTQNNSWDGTFNGQELPGSDYWFAVTRSNGTEHKGHFSLKR